MSLKLRFFCTFATPFGVTLIFLVLLEAAGLSWISRGGGNREISFDWNVSQFGIAGIYLLVTVNTYIFTRTVFPILSPLLGSPTLTKKERKHANFAFSSLSFALYVGALLSVAIAALVVGAWSGLLRDTYWIGQWTNLLRCSEYASCLIFFLFCYADWKVLRLCRLALRKRCAKCNNNAIEDTANDVQKYILAVDGPAFLGMIAIVSIAELIFPHSVADYRHASIPFWLGFSAGAVTLHVAFSQASLAFLQASHTMLPFRLRDTLFMRGILKSRRASRVIKSWFR